MALKLVHVYTTFLELDHHHRNSNIFPTSNSSTIREVRVTGPSWSIFPADLLSEKSGKWPKFGLTTQSVKYIMESHHCTAAAYHWRQAIIFDPPISPALIRVVVEIRETTHDSIYLLLSTSCQDVEAIFSPCPHKLLSARASMDGASRWTQCCATRRDVSGRAVRMRGRAQIT